MSPAAWTLIMLVATAVCAFTLKSPQNPLRGFITTRLFFVHIILGFITTGLAVATVVSQ